MRLLQIIRGQLRRIYRQQGSILCGIGPASDPGIIAYSGVLGDVLTVDPATPTGWKCAAGGGGGGVTDHTALTSLAWTASGHTGTAYHWPAFTSAGAATSYLLSYTSSPLTPKHGWPLNSSGAYDFTLAYDAATRVLTLTRTGATMGYWRDGLFVDLGASVSTVAHAATDGAWYFYYTSAGVLTVSSAPWAITATAATCTVPIAVVVLDTTTAPDQAILFDERHTAYRSLGWHVAAHLTIGARREPTGGVFSGYTLATDTLAGTQWALSAVTIHDEDLPTTTPAVAAAGPYLVAWRTGASGTWTWDATRTLPWLSDGAGAVAYNAVSGGLWSRIKASNAGGQYMAVWVYAWNAYTSSQRVVIIPGQAVYSTLTAARAETPASLALGSLPSPEMVPIGRVILDCKNSYSDTTEDVKLAEVLRYFPTGGSATLSGTAGVHSSLSGLAWTGSGHTDTALSVPVFDAGGAASALAIGTASQVLQVDGTATGYQWLTLGGAALLSVGTTAGTVAAGDSRWSRAIHSSDIVAGTYYYVMGGVFELANRTDHPIARAIGAVSPEYGWTWTGLTKISAADEQTTTAGVATITTTASTGAYNYASRTAARRARAVTQQPGTSWWHAIRVTNATMPTAAGSHFGQSVEDSTPTTSRIAMNYIYLTGGGTYSLVADFSYSGGDITLVTVASIAAATIAAGIWLCIEIDSAGSVVYKYSTTNTDDPTAATWITYAISTATNTAYRLTPHTYTAGYHMAAGSATSYTMAVRRCYYGAREDVSFGTVMARSPQWSATQYDTSGATQLLGYTDHGTAILPSEARLRVALASKVNRRPGDTATVEWSVVGTAAAVAPGAGAWQAAAAVTVGATAYRYWWVYCRITSTGDTQGSVDMRAPLVLEAA